VNGGCIIPTNASRLRNTRWTYEIVGPLGAGGWAKCIAARDTRLGREVAVKVLPAAFADRCSAHAPLRTRSAHRRNVESSNVLPFTISANWRARRIWFTEASGRPDLRQRLEEGPIPQRKALEYAQQIARGLAAAHDKASLIAI